MFTTRLIRRATVSALAFIAIGIAPLGVSASDTYGQRLTFNFQAQTTSQIVVDVANCPDDDHLQLDVSGAGESSLLGAFIDAQSHCLRRDGTFYNGRFTFTGGAVGGPPGGVDSVSSISGEYHGHLVPTFNSLFPPPAPLGYWLVYGEVCVSGGTGRFAHIANDWAARGGNGIYFPARGTADLDTGQANLFGSGTLRIM